MVGTSDVIFIEVNTLEPSLRDAITKRANLVAAYTQAQASGRYCSWSNAEAELIFMLRESLCFRTGFPMSIQQISSAYVTHRSGRNVIKAHIKKLRKNWWRYNDRRALLAV